MIICTMWCVHLSIAMLWCCAEIGACMQHVQSIVLRLPPCMRFRIQGAAVLSDERGLVQPVSFATDFCEHFSSQVVADIFFI